MTKKDVIMEKLYSNPPVMLTTDELLFLASYIPDNTEENGSYKKAPDTVLICNHNSDNVFEALGLTNEEISNSAKELIEIERSLGENPKKSELIAAFYNRASKAAKVLLIAKARYNIGAQPNDMIEMLIRKLLGGSRDKDDE